MRYFWLAVLILLSLGQAVHAGSFDESYSLVLSTLSGQPTQLLATPQFCGDPPPTSNSLDEEIRWRVDGVGTCKAIYQPDPRSFFTPLSTRAEISQFFFDDSKYGALLAAIRDMARTFPREIDPLYKLDIQMTFWEMVAALEWRRDLKVSWEPVMDQEKLDELVGAATAVLGLSRFSRKEIAALNDEAAANKRFAGLRQRIAKGCYLEAALVGGVHESMSQGRLYGRTFLGARDDASCTALRSIVSEGNRTRMVQAPQEVDRFNSILILYYNVLDEHFNVVSTNLIHSWREIQYRQRMDQSKNIDEKFNFVTFSVIERKKRIPPESEADAYRDVSMDKVVSIGGLVDVNPVYGANRGAKGTWDKANCYSCHSSKVKSFDVRILGGDTKVKLYTPFATSTSSLRNDALYSYIESQFSAWQKKYVDSSENRTQN